MTSQENGGYWITEKNINPGLINLGPNQYFNEQKAYIQNFFQNKKHSFGSQVKYYLDQTNVK